MFLFPLVYILSFLKTVKGLLQQKPAALLVFFAIGLPIYINALSVTHLLGFSGLVPIIQSFKEIVVLLGLGVISYQIKRKHHATYIDTYVLLFLAGSFVYALLPIGSYTLFSRLLALKSISFFCLLYLIGRLISIGSVRVSKFFSLIAFVTIIAALIIVFEYITYTHLHTYTGFTNFLIDFFDGESSGNYGLIWTFEIESGLKRFGSIFSSPLELAAAMIFSLAVFFSYFTNKENKLQINKFSVACFLAAFTCIILALSRASLLGFIVVIYFYAIITKNTLLRRAFYIAFALTVFYFIYFLSQHDMYDFIVESITFANASSLGHLLEWVDGITAMMNNPLGLGLGESGRISMSAKQNTGGENQFIITGVQVGIPLLLIYLLIHISLIKEAWKNKNNSSGKLRRIVLVVLLFKLGVLLPMFTSNTESFIYMSYCTWFLSGLMINMLEQKGLLKYTKLKR